MNTDTSTMKLTILGSGTSTGIPMLGCECPVCTSKDPKDKRLRTGIVIDFNDSTILIDTNPDLRAQLIRERITSIDAALITHAHADHIHGIDDLRPLTFKRDTPIPIHSDHVTAQTLQRVFSYIFAKNKLPPIGGGIPKLGLEVFKRNEESIQEVFIENLKFSLFSLPHGRFQTTGFLVGKFAYVIDCHEIPEHVIAFLAGSNIDLLIIDCVTTDNQHKTHLSTDKCFDYIRRISPSRAGLIHMGHKLAHEQLELKAHTELTIETFVCYDGQKIIINS